MLHLMNLTMFSVCDVLDMCLDVLAQTYTFKVNATHGGNALQPSYVLYAVDKLQLNDNNFETRSNEYFYMLY